MFIWIWGEGVMRDKYRRISCLFNWSHASLKHAISFIKRIQRQTATVTSEGNTMAKRTEMEDQRKHIPNTQHGKTKACVTWNIWNIVQPRGLLVFLLFAYSSFVILVLSHSILCRWITVHLHVMYQMLKTALLFIMHNKLASFSLYPSALLHFFIFCHCCRAYFLAFVVDNIPTSFVTVEKKLL